MNPLFHAHSGLRYLVLLAAVVSIGLCVLGLIQNKALTRPARISFTVFIASLHTQVLLGLGLVLMGTWYPKLIGHLVMMVAAAGLAHGLILKNRKSATPGYRLPLIAIGGALVLIIGGIYAIGRNPLLMTPVAGSLG